MKKPLFYMALFVLTACGQDDRSYPPPPTPQYSPCADWEKCVQPDGDHNCTKVAWDCDEHACVEVDIEENTLCFGKRDDVVHGRCDGAGECVIQDWTCIGDPDRVDGVSCWSPHTNSWGLCSEQECCTGCLNTSGQCQYTQVPAGGYACP